MRLQGLTGRLLGLFGSAVVACLVGCAGQERPACSPEALATLEAAYVAEITRACAGSTLEDCDQAEQIEATHQVRLQEWVQCQ